MSNQSILPDHYKIMLLTRLKEYLYQQFQVLSKRQGIEDPRYSFT